MTNFIGQSLGRYHILEQLGEGGMAVVYKAFDTRLERNVAVKVILPGKEHSEKFLKRFEREAKSLAQLSHPNIVKVVDYGEQDGLPYLVMEYLPGGTLKKKLTGKSISWQQAIKLLIPIARALDYAHQHKIVHRDIKPSNILITDSGEPMLSDFGISKMLEAEETMDLTGTGVGVGTPEYMSPEQAQGKSVDIRSDIYSLGVVLYEMVTGRRPYQADTPMAVVWKLASEPLPRPKQFMTELPDALDGILIKMLAKQAEQRYQGLGELIPSLEKLANSTITKGRVSERKGFSWIWLAITGMGLMIIGSFMGIAIVKGNPLVSKATPTLTATHTQTPTATASPRPTATRSFTKTPTPTLPANLVNVALNKPVTITLNGVQDNRSGIGIGAFPEDVTDGSLDYIPTDMFQEDGCIGFVNSDYGELMQVTIVIDLQGTFEIYKIRYTMGNVEWASSWGADSIKTPFGLITNINKGMAYTGNRTGTAAWTEQTGHSVLSEITIVLSKTRTLVETDWLFIGEIEIYGIPKN